MYSFTKELYYGNISPEARRYEPDSDYAKVSEKAVETEEKLSKLLSGEAKRLFSEFSENNGKLLCESETAAFIDGFRLGAHFVFNTFVSTENAFFPIAEGMY